MSYAYGQINVDLGSVTLTGTGIKARWTPGYIPWWIRACSLVVTTQETTTPVVTTFSPEVVAKSGSLGTAICTLNILTSTVAGKVIYKDALSDVGISPGGDVALNCSTAGSTCVANANMHIEPNYEVPANNTSMVVTT